LVYVTFLVFKSWHIGVSGVDVVLNTVAELNTGRRPSTPVFNTVGVELMLDTGVEHGRCRPGVHDRCLTVGVDAVVRRC
jgi:hypothetical protein